MAIIHELALYQVVGGPGVLRRQLRQLLQWAERSNIKIHVLPNTAAHAGVSSGAFTTLRLPGRPAVVFVENLTSSLFVEEAREVEVYDEALRNFSSRVLDEQRSCEMIAMLAKRLETGADEHEGDRITCLDMAQEQSLGYSRELC